MKQQQYSIGDKVFLNYFGPHPVTIAETLESPDGYTFYKVRYGDGHVSNEWFPDFRIKLREDLL